MTPKGLLFSSHRLSTDDGPGLRDTFFLKGCGLRCAWCHNPESITPIPEIWWLEQKCIGARDCIRVCPEDALELTERGIEINRDRCTVCGLCVDACPSRAIEIIGKSWSVEALVAEALKERAFFRNSGGGVTLSGGEPCLQPEFAAGFFEACRHEGIHTALDTCGYPRWEAIKAVLRHTDLVLYDLKEMDPARHLEFTGGSNEQILSNLLRLRDFVREDGTRPAIWIRTPLVPDYTATEENISAIGSFINDHLGERAERWELCAFNNTCAAKYQKLGRRWTFEGRSLLDREVGNRLLETARNCLDRPESVHLTGLV